MTSFKITTKLECEVPGNHEMREVEKNNEEDYLVPVFEVRKEETSFTKGDLKLQRIVVTESNLESNNGSTNTTSKIPRQRQVFEKIAVARHLREEENEILLMPLVTSSPSTVENEETNEEIKNATNKYNGEKIYSPTFFRNTGNDNLYFNNKDDSHKRTTSNASDNINEESEVEFDQIYDKIVDEDANFDHVAPVIEDKDNIDTEFDRIVKEYDVDNKKRKDTEKIKTRIPFNKQKSLQDVLPKRNERRRSLKEFVYNDEPRTTNTNSKDIKDIDIAPNKEYKDTTTLPMKDDINPEIWKEISNSDIIKDEKTSIKSIIVSNKNNMSKNTEEITTIANLDNKNVTQGLSKAKIEIDIKTVAPHHNTTKGATKSDIKYSEILIAPKIIMNENKSINANEIKKDTNFDDRNVKVTLVKPAFKENTKTVTTNDKETTKREINKENEMANTRTIISDENAKSFASEIGKIDKSYDRNVKLASLKPEMNSITSKNKDATRIEINKDNEISTITPLISDENSTLVKTDKVTKSDDRHVKETSLKAEKKRIIYTVSSQRNLKETIKNVTKDLDPTKFSITSRIAIFENQSSKDLTKSKIPIPKPRHRATIPDFPTESTPKPVVIDGIMKTQITHKILEENEKETENKIKVTTPHYTEEHETDFDFKVDIDKENTRKPLNQNVIGEENIIAMVNSVKENEKSINNEFNEALIAKNEDGVQKKQSVDKVSNKNKVLSHEEVIISNSKHEKTSANNKNQSRMDVIENQQIYVENLLQKQHKTKHPKTNKNVVKKPVEAKNNIMIERNPKHFPNKTISVFKLGQALKIFDNNDDSRKVVDTNKLRRKSATELDIEDKMKGKVQSMIDKIKSIDNLSDKKPESEKPVINARERPRRKSVSDKIALFEAKRLEMRTIDI